jgi:hypothetical protein
MKQDDTPWKKIGPKEVRLLRDFYGHQNDDIMDRGKPSQSLVQLESYLNLRKNLPNS